jgi:hypothetical protein
LSYPATAVLWGDGTSTATLGTTIGGFGSDFGLSFGAPTVVGPVDATVTSLPATATLAQVPALAELQLV